MPNPISLALAGQSWLDLVFYAGVVGLAAGLFTRSLSRRAAGGLGGGVATYLAGCGLNLVALAANGWRMPGLHVAPDRWHVLATPTTHLPWLVDRFAIVGPPREASAGDFLVWSGELAIALGFLAWIVSAPAPRSAASL